MNEIIVVCEKYLKNTKTAPTETSPEKTPVQNLSRTSGEFSPSNLSAYAQKYTGNNAITSVVNTFAKFIIFF